MEIKGFVAVSLSDWDGTVSSVLFLPGCNMRCPFCYNSSLVLHPEKMPTIDYGHVESYLETNQKWIDGVVITGGEPTLHADLPLLCQKIKSLGFEVKVDTNGTSPAMISGLIEKRLIDFVALDVKTQFTKRAYSMACGVDASLFLEKILETAHFLLNGTVGYEFRTTVVPTLHRIEEIKNLCQRIKGCSKYALQNFKSDVETINPKYQKLKPFSKTQMDSFLQAAKKVVPNSVRG